MNQHQQSVISASTLYVVPTPIGNLGDITHRALEVLKSVDPIAAEDTRHTGLLLQHFAINARLFALHDHNEQQKPISCWRNCRKARASRWCPTPARR